MSSVYYTTEDNYKWTRDDIAIKFKGSIIGLRDEENGDIIPIRVERLTGDDEDIEYVDLNTRKYGRIDFHHKNIVQDVVYKLGYIQEGHQAYYLFKNNEYTQKKGLPLTHLKCIPCSAGVVQFLYSRLIGNQNESTKGKIDAILETASLYDLIPYCFKERPVIKLSQSVVMMESGDYLSIALSPDFAIGIVPTIKSNYKLFYKAHIIGDISKSGEYSLDGKFVFLKELVEETIV